jgi:hypothetical protein
MLPGLGDLHLPNPDEEEEQQEELSSSDSGHEQVASKWDKSVVSLAPFNEGAYLYTSRATFCATFISSLRVNIYSMFIEITFLSAGGSVHPVCTGIVFDHTNRRALLMVSLSMFRSGDAGRRINYNMTVGTAKFSGISIDCLF